MTTLVDMPLNSIPPTTTLENLKLKREAAEGQCWTDVAFWGGIVPGNEASWPKSYFLSDWADHDDSLPWGPWLRPGSRDSSAF